MSRLLAAAGLLALALAAGPAAAWNNHALGTWPALASMVELQALPPVAAEPLASFLAADAAGVAATLEREEDWARRHVPTYPPLPAALAFRPQVADGDALIARFVAATRINPQARLALFLQLPPGVAAAGRPTPPASAVTIFENAESSRFDTFVGLRAGEPARPVDVVATASDEPDYGLDIGLWSDAGTPQGAAYGLGRQPFGNPKVAIASQAPMHMGFFHESPIVYAAASFLRRTYPEHRVHLWRSLSAEAFRSGHPYWGWRFAGWALHYVQDLTQPYHARVLPGASTVRMLWINALDLAGWHGPRERAVAFVTNRHFALENYLMHWLRGALLSGASGDPALRALAGNGPPPPFDDGSLRGTIGRESHDAADAVDAALVAALPLRYTSDPSYVFGTTEPAIDLHAAMATADPAARAALDRSVLPLVERFGVHTRSFIAAVLKDAGGR